MIPQQLSLKNFLSYREMTLDFRGLHTACICGANGAGKSSLLEAITWVIWGRSRAEIEDDILHTGTSHGRVDFQFISHQQTYKIVRSRHRGKSSALDFLIQDHHQFRSLSGKGLKATQEKIIEVLKLDYDTFTNSAYLRQGQADEFMKRGSRERKQVLADLLKLDQYEILAEKAKDIYKEKKGQIELLEGRLQSLEQQLEQRQELEAYQQQITQEIAETQQKQEQEQWQLQQLQLSQNQRRTWQKQLDWHQDQIQASQRESQGLEQEKQVLLKQQQALNNLLNQENTITDNYQFFLQLQNQEVEFAQKFQQFQEIQQQQQQLEQRLLSQDHQLRLELKQLQLRLSTLHQQEQELQPLLSRTGDIQKGLVNLQTARQRLADLDHLQHQVAPLQQRQHQVQTALERVKLQLQAALEQKQLFVQQLQAEIMAIPQKRQALQGIDQEIKELDKKKVYQKRVQEKGQERRHFQERLQEHQKLWEEQLEEISQKLLLLETPGATCPLCEQHLDGHYHQQVIEKTQAQQKELQEQIWLIKEQIAVSERELQILRTEYAHIQEALSGYDALQQHYGQLEAELERAGEVYEQKSVLQLEIQQLEDQLSQGNYAQELQQELLEVTQELQALQYDEQRHSLARGAVDQYRWAEIQNAKLEDAQRQLNKISQEKPYLVQQITNYEQTLQNLHQTSEVYQQLQAVKEQFQDLGYERSRHQDLLEQLRGYQVWQLRYQECQQAKEQILPLQQRLEENQQRLEQRQQQLDTLHQELTTLQEQVNHYADHEAQILTLEQQISDRRRQLDELLSRKGRYEQIAIQLDTLREQFTENQQELQETKKQYRIHQELAKAFGKNGIQTLMIENILPQLETETNHLLARLTGNQLHIQFVTQKATKSTAKKASPKFIDTLDILIADAQGTRPYETYSGGEAFRINFSIRLALAKLLAQQAGTALQLLIIDEGFGTQDAEGCERLVAAINVIASDFACILTVTHMPQFKEAFQQRIEVHKSNQGSQVRVIG